MRILHTADWHLKDRLGRQDRTADICRSLRKIAGYLDDGAVDVMIVAGDIFRELSMRPDEVRDALSDVREIFLPFIERGGSIIATLGNHDRDVYFEMMKNALDLVAPLPKIDGQSLKNGGRIYFVPKADILPLQDKNGRTVQFVLMPYPTGAYLVGEQGLNFKNVEEKNRAIQDTYRRVLESFKKSACFDVSLPSVLVSHIHVRGTELHGRFRLTEAESVMFDDVPTGWCYTALGHIHQGQEAIKGAPHVRYSGSIERLDAGERKDEKGVVLFEIGADNRLTNAPEILPVEATEFIEVEISDPKNEIGHLRDKYANAGSALVKYTLNYDAHEDNWTEMCRDIERAFPRWYSREIVPSGTEQASVSVSLSAEKMRDVPNVVHEYLATQFKENPHRGELLQLADQLLADEFSTGGNLQ